jgi:hypothetical protein
VYSVSVKASTSYKTVEERVRYHNDRAKLHKKRMTFHEKRALEWERLLAQIQDMQRDEQKKADAERGERMEPVRTTRAANRNDFAREVLHRYAKEGVLPADVRRLANQQGISAPTNYPYKLFTLMVKQGKARKDETSGRYYPEQGAESAKKGKKRVFLKED